MTDQSDRLRKAREDAGFTTATEAAQRYHWTLATYHGHENGSRGLTPETARKYADAFRVSPEWLLFGTRSSALVAMRPDDAPPGSELVSVYNVQASAGFGAINDGEFLVDQVAFPPNYLRHISKGPIANLAIIGVKGDSMAPTLKDDDIVMVDTTKGDLSWGGIFVLRVDGDGLLVKRIGMGSQRDYVKIKSDNPVFPEVERHKRDVDVVGRVIWYGVKV